MPKPERPEAPDDRMFIGHSVPSVDRGVVSEGLLFIARRPDSPYLVPDIEYLRSTPARLAADQMLEALKAASTFMVRQSNSAFAMGEPLPLASEGNEVLNRLEAASAAAKGEEDR